MMRAALAVGALIVAGCVPVAPPSARPPSPTIGREPIRATPPVLPVPLLTKAQLLAQPRFTSLRRAFIAARLEGMLAGPMTVIAPDDTAWAALAPGVQDDLLKPENRGSLAALLRFQLVPGRVDFNDLRRRAIAGPVRLPTLAGEPITAAMTGTTLALFDGTGHWANVTAAPGVSDGAVLPVTVLLVPQALGPQPRPSD